jgi:uncharacterized membrane protein
MSIDAATLAAILAMAAATYLTRAAGFLFMQRLRITGRMKAGLEALPPAILMAVIAPTVFATGIAETLAAAAAALAAILRLPLLVVVVTGVVSVVVLRALIG